MDSVSQSADIMRKLVCTDCVGQELNEKANDYRERRQWDDAIEFAQLSLDLCLKGDHMRSIGIAQTHLGAIYYAKGALREALEFFERSRDSFIYDRRNRSISFLAIARVQQKLGEWKAVLEAYESCLEILKGLDQVLYSELHQEYEEVIQCLPPKSLPMLVQAEEGGKRIPIGRVAAGDFALAEEDSDDHVFVTDEIADQVDFALRAQGDSMVNAGILDGDLVLMQKREDPPPNGRIVAVTIAAMDSEATLKRFYNEGDHIRLEPANDGFPLIIVKPDSLPETTVRDRYSGSHPKRLLQFHSGAKPRIAGWAQALIREKTS